MLRISSETCILLLIFPLICYFLMCGILVLISYHICVVLISYIWVAWWIDDLEGLHILVAVPVSKIGRSNSAILCHVKLDKHEGWADSICQITCKHEGFRTYHSSEFWITHALSFWFILSARGDHFRFSKQIGFFFFLNWNRTGSSLVWFGYFRTKTGLVRFNFFGFRLRKPNPNWTGQFFKNSNWFNWFFSRFGFFGYFFLFSWFNHYFSFFAHPSCV